MRWRRERGRDGKNRLRVGTERGEGEWSISTDFNNDINEG